MNSASTTSPFKWILLCILIHWAGFTSGQSDADLYRTHQLDLPGIEQPPMAPPSPTLQHQPVTADAARFLLEYDRQAAEMCNRVTAAEWRYATNASDYNRRRMNEQLSIAAKFECLSWRRAAAIDVQRIGDPLQRRLLVRLRRAGKCGLGDDKFAEYQLLVAQMKETFAAARVCAYQDTAPAIDARLNDIGLQPISYGPPPSPPSSSHPAQSRSSSTAPASYYCDLRLDPDVQRTMATSRNERELRHLWREWHEQTGPPLLNTFMRYVDVANQAARAHGFRDAGDQQRAAYDDGDFYFTVQDLWSRVRPLYKQLFTYVRRALLMRYGSAVVRPDGPLPAHLLANMWTQNWQHLGDVVPTPGPRQLPAVAAEMQRQGFSALKIFQTAEEFFTSLGLPPMSPEFWRNSQLQAGAGGDTSTCTASAWDFCNNVDFRVRQCTQTTREDFVNAHHEMTHVQYFMQYAGKAFAQRDAPNPGFAEAVAHAVGLSVAGPAHLQHLGLLPVSPGSNSAANALSIEYLLDVALDKLPLMSFALALEKWRWHVFEKGPVGMNARWWDLRMRYQGIVPPVARTAQHLDAAGKWQVVADEDYVRYFVSTVLQFQIFAELCEAAGFRGALHMCDVYRSREAGRMLSDLMQQGASLSASDLLKLVTRGRTSRLSVEPLLEFFRPLEAWLEQQNRYEIVVGWNSNVDDVALFQGLQGSGATATTGSGLRWLDVGGWPKTAAVVWICSVAFAGVWGWV